MAKKYPKIPSNDWLSMIRSLQIFQNVSNTDIEYILSDKVSKKHVIEPNNLVIKQGDSGSSLFIICDGEITVSVDKHGESPIKICTLNAGDVFGEMALFGQSLRSASLTTATMCKLLEIQGANFLALLRKNPEISLHLLSKFSQRLRHTDELIWARQIDGVGNSIEGMQAQIDSIFNITDAKLAAAQAIFDQTNKRSGEIIESAGRARTRMTWLASTATVVFGLIATIGFINFDSARDEIQHTQRLVAESRTKIEDMRNDVESNASEVRRQAEIATSAASNALEKSLEAGESSNFAKQAAIDIEDARKLIDVLRRDIQEVERKSSAAYYNIIFDSFKNDLYNGTIKDVTTEHFVELFSRAPQNYKDNVRNFLYSRIFTKNTKERSVLLLNIDALLTKTYNSDNYIEEKTRVYIYYFGSLINILLQNTDKLNETNSQLADIVTRTNIDFTKFLASGQHDPERIKDRASKLDGLESLGSQNMQELFDILTSNI